MSYPEPDKTTWPARCSSRLNIKGASKFIVVPWGLSCGMDAIFITSKLSTFSIFKISTTLSGKSIE